ncbi:MAG: methyltransferase domain-containing protein [Nitrospinota bacterium]|nr:methyltransferase domain-containing protein [Nitrospinota bacterium]
MLTSSITRKVIRAFDRSAGEYSLYARFQDEIAQQTAKMALSHARPGLRILDIGCGTGALMGHILPAARPSVAMAMDASAAMVRIAAQRLEPLGAGVIHARAEALPFSAGSFDIVVSSLAMQWVADIGPFLAQAARMLRPDGALVAATLGPGTFPELKLAVSAALEGKAGQRLNFAADFFPSTHRLKEELARAGFSAEVTQSLRPRQYANFYDFIRSLKKVGALGPAALSGAGLARRGFLGRVEKEYAALLKNRGDSGFTATYEVIFIKARREG